MRKITLNNNKSIGWRRFEFAVLIVCLLIIALRGTHMESTQSAMTSVTGMLDGPAWSVIITSVLIFTAAIWGMISFSSRKIFFRFSGIEFGAVLFLTVAIFGILSASNKREAITETATISAVFALGVLLVQLLDSQRRIRLLLMVVTAAGAVNSYQCSEQFFVSNDMMIQQYENNPEVQLAQMGIEPGSFEHALYLHRLESKDVRGFFTTGNSAATFNVLALTAALALLVSEIRSKIDRKIKNRNIGIYTAYAAAIIFGIVLTHSKGGIAGAFLATMLFGVAVVCGKWFSKYTKQLVITGVILAIAAIMAIAAYGVKNDGLGGGNSLLVRWQYWTAAAEISRDNLLTGVGGGNFASAYTQYKTPEALETVNDPHCFALSILSKYGILGLIGFIAAFAVPMLTTIFNNKKTTATIKPAENPGQWKYGAIAATILTLGLGFARSIVMNETMGSTAEEKIFMVLYLYVSAGVVFGVSLLFLWIAGKDRPEEEHEMFGKGERTLILCGLVGVLAHNMVDFAIFEPGVFTLFISMVACAVAISFKNSGNNAIPTKLTQPMRVIGIAACVIVAAYFVRCSLMPTVKTSYLKQQPMQSFDKATDLLDSAAAADLVNPEYLNMGARLYLQMFMNGTNKSPDLLANSVERFERAIERDPADFKNYEKIAEVCNLWSQVLSVSDRDAATEKLQKAYDNLKHATELYPGSGRIWYKLGEATEKLGNKDESVNYYAKAVEIEKAYREMFKIMYPGRELTSRLGSNKYETAKGKIEVK